MTGPNPATSPAAPAGPPSSARAGSIYDLGYRRYEGPRLGRAHAIRSLIMESVRSAFGLGRGGRSKVAPAVFGAMAVFPAIVIVGVLTLAVRLGVREQIERASLISYDGYFNSISAVIALFCAAQAPELFGRDQRHGVIALYFARPLRRSDYALARLAGFVIALLALLLLPQTILLVGRGLLSIDVASSFGEDLPKVPAIVGQALLTAGLLGCLAMTVSAFTPRRAYATAGIIAIFILPGIVSGIVIQLGSSGIGNWLVLLSQGAVLDGTNALLFGHSLPEGLFFFDLPPWSFLASALVTIAVSVALVVRRFSRIAT
jgi:ABC-2 type transport system permease protein